MIINMSEGKSTDEARRNSKIWLILSQLIAFLGPLPWFALLAFACSEHKRPDRFINLLFDQASLPSKGAYADQHLCKPVRSR